MKDLQHKAVEPAARAGKTAKHRILFAYWGRRGLSEFCLLFADAIRELDEVEAVFSVSRQNDRFEDFSRLGDALEPVDTFGHTLGVVCAWRVRRIRKALAARIARDRIDTVVSMMPHVWTPLIASAVTEAGARFVSIVHDAAPHPGDIASAVASWGQKSFHDSDLVLTLSSHVTRSLTAGGMVAPGRVRTLFHPELHLAKTSVAGFPARGEPFRVLFLGRILPYKGLDLLIDAVDALRRDGLNVTLGVFGDGVLGAARQRLEALDAKVVNRWLAPDEITDALSRYHAVVLSHIEASQSGVAALALGHGVPVIANPVGGLAEQIEDGVTGLVAERVDRDALAAAIRQMAGDRVAYQQMQIAIRLSQSTRSMRAFAQTLVDEIAALDAAEPAAVSTAA